MSTNTAILPSLPQNQYIRWDYRVANIHERHVEGFQKALCDFGIEGWELVFINCPVHNEYICVFRRMAQ